MSRPLSFIALLSLFSLNTHALDFRNWAGGRQIMSPAAPSQYSEICVLPKSIPDGEFKPGDLETEQNLCKLSFYETYGVCPKLVSTNPGVEIYKLKAPLDKATFEAKNCANPKAIQGAKKIAKFKQSVSCSYTPSILFYYQLSRALGGAGHVPPAVIRTMNVGEHQKLDIKAARILTGRNDVISKTWATMGADDRNLRAHPELYDFDHDLLYGALSENPGSEQKYSELNKFPSYGERYPAFMSKPAVRAVMTDAPITQLLGADKVAAIPLMVEYKDVTDMILMDTLLNQQDRIGNIHYKCKHYILDASGTIVDKQKADCTRPVAPKGERAVLVKEMLLKDNDCGVAKGNMFQKVGALTKVRHLSPETYRRFMNTTAFLSTAEGRSWLKHEMLFTDADILSVLKNAGAMRATLLAGCAAGSLRLDLDLNSYLAGKLSADTRSLCQ